MTQGKVSAALRTNNGFAFITLVETKAPYVPKLDEVKDKVREDVIRLKAVDVAKEGCGARASREPGQLRGRRQGRRRRRQDDGLRRARRAYPEVGVSSLVDNAVFGLKAGATSAPITTDTAVIVARSRSGRTSPTPRLPPAATSCAPSCSASAAATSSPPT